MPIEKHGDHEISANIKKPTEYYSSFSCKFSNGLLRRGEKQCIKTWTKEGFSAQKKFSYFFKNALFCWNVYEIEDTSFKFDMKKKSCFVWSKRCTEKVLSSLTFLIILIVLFIGNKLNFLNEFSDLKGLNKCTDQNVHYLKRKCAIYFHTFLSLISNSP